MLQNTPGRKYTYALKTYADYRGQLLESQFTGQLLKIEEQELWTQLLGEFNAYNVLCVYAIADLLDMERMERLRLLSELQPVQGRFQYMQSPQKIHAIVDYAHTPDALKNVLTTVSALRTGNEKVIAVVGCGGDRDRSKRPVMGHIAASMSDQSIFTSDNPRSESPSAILEEMQEGVGPELKGRVLVIEDRRQAIRTAARLAESGDILLVAGKGHETYQEIDGVRHPFDDMEELQQAFNQI
jgi:UDP-N-acetylmuramoyl-L-alanyl-D-glutamate--2,6-diaminopimelate ligase